MDSIEVAEALMLKNCDGFPYYSVLESADRRKRLCHSAFDRGGMHHCSFRCGFSSFF